jgi:hypothetical protein
VTTYREADKKNGAHLPGGLRWGRKKAKRWRSWPFPKNRRLSEFEGDKKVGRYTDKIRREREETICNNFQNLILI